MFIKCQEKMTGTKNKMKTKTKTILKTQMSNHFYCLGLNLQWCFKNVTKNVKIVYFMRKIWCYCIK